MTCINTLFRRQNTQRLHGCNLWGGGGWEGESRGPLLWKSGGLPWEVSPLPLGV